MNKLIRMHGRPRAARGKTTNRLMLWLSLLSPALAATVFAQSGMNGSGWPGFRHNAALTARTTALGPIAPELKWKALIGSGQLGAPVVGANGAIYVAGNENDTLYAVTPEGRLQWTFTGKKLANEKFVAPPVIGKDGVIYLGSTKNIFYAVDPDGKARWSTALQGEVRFSPNIGVDGTIYVAAQDCKLYAILPDGKIKWNFNLDRYPGNGPAISSDGTIYTVAGEFLKGFDATGALRLNVNAEIGVLRGLMIEGSELIYVTAGESPLLRVFSNSGRMRWGYAFPASFGPPLLPAQGKDGALFLPSSKTGEIIVLNHDGTKRRSYTTDNAAFLTELVADDSNHVYLVHANLGLSSFGSGRQRWSLPEVRCEFSPAIDADGNIYVASAGKLYAIRTRPPQLLADTKNLTWGGVCAGNSATLSFRISNQSLSTLQLNDFVVSNPVFQVAPGNVTLPPNASQILQVKFSPTDFIVYNGALTIRSSAGNVVVALQGHGLGPQSALGAAALAFGEVMLGKTAMQSAAVLNLASCDLRIDSVKVSGANSAAFVIEAAGLPKNVVKGDTGKISVRFVPQALGAQQAALFIYNNARQQNPLVVKLEGNGSTAQPDIDAPPALDFGKVCAESFLTAVIANVGAKELRIDSLRFSDTVFGTAHDPSFKLAAGAQEKIVIRFKPNGAAVNGTLSIFSNDQDENPLLVKLQGAAGAPNFAGANNFDFGAVEIQTCAGLSNAATRTYAIRNTGSCELKIDSLTTLGYFALVSASVPAAIPAGGEWKVMLKFSPPAAGDYTGKLRIVKRDPNASVFVVTLNGRGAAIPDIAANLDTLNFGAVPIGTKKTAALKLRNLGSLPLAVSRFEISAPQFTTTAPPMTLVCKQDSALAITFMPDSEDRFNGTLSITSNDPDEGTFKIHLRGSGARSLQALIETDSSKYRFPPTCLGSTVSLQVAVHNPGNAALQIDSINVQTNREVFGVTTAGFTLEAQASKTVPVFFTPKQRTIAGATLQFFSNATNTRVYEVQLLGKGSAPEISGLAPLVFPAIQIDSTHRENYVVNNIGDCALSITGVKIEGLHADNFKVVAAGSSAIAPRGASQITLEFKPTGATARQASLIVLSSDPARPRFEVPLSGNGNGAPGKLAGPNAIDFGKACFDETLTRDIVISNTGKSDLSITQVRLLRGEFFRLLTPVQLPKRLNPQEMLTLQVSFATRNTVAVKDSLLIQTDAVTNSPVRVALQGAGREDNALLSLSNQAVAFNGRLDEPKEEILSITNVGCGTLEISQVELVRKVRVFSVRPESPLPVKLEKTQTLRVQVLFAGDDFKSFADSLYIYCVDWQQNRERLGVSLFGNVTDGAPCLDVSLSKVEFGDVPVGQSKRADLEIKNCSADSRLIVKALAPKRNDFQVLQDSLAIFPGNPQFLTVNYAPKSNGEIADTLKLVYYSFADPRQKSIERIVLHGTATGTQAYARPNAFTPNGDGKNDEAKILFTGFDPNAVVVRIYDLRGLEVRQLKPNPAKRDAEFRWDGRNEGGQLQMPGAYLWLLEESGKKLGSGQLVLIR